MRGFDLKAGLQNLALKATKTPEDLTKKPAVEAAGKKPAKKATHDIECDTCGAPAAFNFQKVWTVFKVTDDGGYQKLDVDPMDFEEPTDEDNEHLCATCAKEQFGFDGE
jgi:hypothetical protein